MNPRQRLLISLSHLEADRLPLDLGSTQAPGSRFIFNTVHNIQADAPVQSMLALFEALQEYGVCP